MLCLFLVLSACATFPELEGTISDAAQAAPYPTLTEIPVPPAASDAAQEVALRARIAALQARAARMRQIQIDALQ